MGGVTLRTNHRSIQTARSFALALPFALIKYRVNLSDGFLIVIFIPLMVMYFRRENRGLRPCIETNQ